MKPFGFRRVDENVSMEQELAGKSIYLALYSEDGMRTEAKCVVAVDLAENINCKEGLESIMIRAAILDSARRHKNPTAPKVQ